MKSRIAIILLAFVASISNPNTSSAVTFKYEGTPGAQIYINYYSPTTTDNSRYWTLGDTGYLTGTWDLDTGAIDISGLFTASNATDADRAYYPDFFFSPISIHISTVITQSYVDASTNPATGNFQLGGGYPTSYQVLGNGIFIDHTNTGNLTPAGAADRSFLSFFGFMYGSVGSPPYTAEIGPAQQGFYMTHVPEPGTFGLTIVGLALSLAFARRRQIVS